MKSLITYTKAYREERGNALFLILIAVALFAALSYAVTQSGRGGGSIDREQALISASQITQYPAAVRTGVTRMIITGTAVSALDFGETATGTAAVFDSSGGGVIFQSPPSNIGGATAWLFLEDSDNYFIDRIGGDAAGTGDSAVEDLMALLRPLSQTVCDQINSGLGLSTGGAETSTITYASVVPHGTATSAATNTFIGYANEPFACSDNNSVENVYYHAIVEQ